MSIQTNFFKRINGTLFKSSAALLIVAGFCLAFLPETTFAFSPNDSVWMKKNIEPDEAFDKKFREGKDLIDKEEWAKAAEKFNEVIGKYPDNKSTDAALYWLAFCYKKQKQFKEIDATLDREDEFKIAAFQSLLSADPNKGIEAMNGILKSDSKASETLKLEVLRVMHRIRAANGYSSLLLAITVLPANPVNGQFTSLLRESLVKSFQNETNIKIRKEII